MNSAQDYIDYEANQRQLNDHVLTLLDRLDEIPMLHLSPWEMTFVVSIKERLNTGQQLTDKQITTLVDILIVNE